MRVVAPRATGTGRAFAYALLVHALAIALLFISFHLPVKSTVYGMQPAPNPVVAQLVNTHALAVARERLAKAQAVQKLKEAEQQAEEARQQAAEQAARAAAKAAAEQARAQAAQAARAQAEAKAAARALARAQAQARAQARAEQAMKQKQARTERLQAARQRAARIAQLQRELDAQQQNARRSAHREAAQAALARQLAREESAREAALSAQQQGIANRYLARIQQKVSLNWVRPPGTGHHLECVVRVRVLPQGDVIAVRIVTSSGDAAFDRSVQVAVYRASPLPLPSDPAIAAAFHQITFTFKPEQ